MSDEAEITIDTIGDAINTVAKGMTASSSENGRSMSQIPIKDLIAADQYMAGKTAAGESHFGLRFTKCIPPGGG